MNKFLDFVCNNYQILISVAALIGTLLLYIFRKKPSSAVYSELKLLILKKLPELINNAEISYGSVIKAGSTKKDLVIGLALELVQKKLTRSLKPDEVLLFRDFTSEALENVLTTPTKKEKEDA